MNTERVWRQILLWAVIGTAVGTMFALVDLNASHDTIGGLMTTSPEMPPAALLRQDFPDEPLFAGGKHDGPYYYAIARDPFDLERIAQSEDRPRYRMQRVFFPLVAWVLHPTGTGGPGLLWTMFAVNVGGILLGSIATGRLSTLLGGPAWPAVVFGALYGSVVSLRITTPDPLALGLALLAVALALDERWRWAVAAGVAAVLTREVGWLILLGFFFWRPSRKTALLAGIPAAVAGAWFLVLLVKVGGPRTNDEFVAPFTGWSSALRFWLDGNEPMGWIMVALGFGLAIAALFKARPRHPLYWAIVLNLLITPTYSASVIGPERNSSRVFLTLQILGLVMLLTPTATGRVERARARHRAASNVPAPATPN